MQPKAFPTFEEFSTYNIKRVIGNTFFLGYIFIFTFIGLNKFITDGVVIMTHLFVATQRDIKRLPVCIFQHHYKMFHGVQENRTFSVYLRNASIYRESFYCIIHTFIITSASIWNNVGTNVLLICTKLFKEQPKENITNYCESDDICIEKGPCCRDKNELFVKDIYNKQKCLISAHAPNDISLPSKVLSYYNRISCPQDCNDTNIKAKYENERVETLADITHTIYSRDGKIIYKKRYCSHRERRIQSWEIIVCLKTLQNGSTLLEHGESLKKTLTVCASTKQVNLKIKSLCIYL